MVGIPNFLFSSLFKSVPEVLYQLLYDLIFLRSEILKKVRGQEEQAGRQVPEGRKAGRQAAGSQATGGQTDR